MPEKGCERQLEERGYGDGEPMPDGDAAALGVGAPHDLERKRVIL
jgi:hypothetical protein